MTETEVRTVFNRQTAEAEADGIPDAIKICPNQYVSIATFMELFGASELSYVSLVARDAGQMGYKTFFDRAKDDGILS